MYVVLPRPKHYGLVVAMKCLSFPVPHLGLRLREREALRLGVLLPVRVRAKYSGFSRISAI